MIKLKQKFGSVICKVEAEGVVSGYEISVLHNQPINGLLTIQSDKNQEITYVCNTRKTLFQEAQQGLHKEMLLNVLRQIAAVVINVQKTGLDCRRIILNQEWMYFAGQSKEIQLIYCPVNGCNINYDFVLFVKDLMLSAKLDVDTREGVKRWTEEIQKNGLTLRSMDMLEALCKKSETAQAGERRSIPVVEEEPHTGMEEEEDEEAPTGMDEDDERRTTNEDDNLYSSLGKKDGTFLETTSESNYYAARPSLRRISTGEKVVISRDEFKIGRSESRADYCITGNNSISNIHATIFTGNGRDYYVKDNHSTNGTTVDGKKVDFSATKLRDGSVICLFNEELEFQF